MQRFAQKPWNEGYLEIKEILKNKATYLDLN